MISEGQKIWDMPSTDMQTAKGLPPEVIVGFLLSGLIPGAIAQDVVVGMLFLLLSGIFFLLYRILRVLELIAAKQ